MRFDKKTVSYLKQKLLFLGVVGVSIFLFVFVITSIWIGYGVKIKCQEAKQEYGESLPAGRQGCVEALTRLLDDENRGFRARNSAIWALGQLGDSRALSSLQKYYTGNMPSREPLDKAISQYELKKAINLTSGGFNITAFIWRRGILRN